MIKNQTTSNNVTNTTTCEGRITECEKSQFVWGLYNRCGAMKMTGCSSALPTTRWGGVFKSTHGRPQAGSVWNEVHTAYYVFDLEPFSKAIKNLSSLREAKNNQE